MSFQPKASSYNDQNILFIALKNEHIMTGQNYVHIFGADAFILTT